MSRTTSQERDYIATKIARGECRNCSNKAKVSESGKQLKRCEQCLETNAKAHRAKRAAAKLPAVKAAKPKIYTKADEAREWLLACRRRNAIAA